MNLSKNKGIQSVVLLVFFMLFFLFSYSVPGEDISTGIKDSGLAGLKIHDCSLFYNEHDQGELVGTILCANSSGIIYEYKTHPSESIIQFIYSNPQQTYTSRKNIFQDDKIQDDCYAIIKNSFSYFMKIIQSLNAQDLSEGKISVKVDYDDGLVLNYSFKRVLGGITFTIITDEWDLVFMDAGKDGAFDYLKATAHKESQYLNKKVFYEFKPGSNNVFTQYTIFLFENQIITNPFILSYYDKN